MELAAVMMIALGMRGELGHYLLLGTTACATMALRAGGANPFDMESYCPGNTLPLPIP